MEEPAWSGGLSPARDLVLPTRPENPDMREAASIWLFEESGAFAFPRIDIEGHAPSWDSRAYNANFTFSGGRVLFDSGQAPAIEPSGEAGVPIHSAAAPSASAASSRSAAG